MQIAELEFLDTLDIQKEKIQHEKEIIEECTKELSLLKQKFSVKANEQKKNRVNIKKVATLVAKYKDENNKLNQKIFGKECDTFKKELKSKSGQTALLTKCLIDTLEDLNDRQ